MSQLFEDDAPAARTRPRIHTATPPKLVRAVTEVFPGMPHVGRYRIIWADYPWPHDNYGQAKHGAAKSQYDELPLEAGKAMPVASLAHEDGALLFLWSTNVQEADGAHRELAGAWGFELTTKLFTWVKVEPKCGECSHQWDEHDSCCADEDLPSACQSEQASDLHSQAHESGEPCPCNRFSPVAFRGPGSYSQQGTESVWLGVRGNETWSASRSNRNAPEVLFAPAREGHSKKPERAQDRAEHLWPEAAPRLELFARRRRPGYAAWGKEAPDCDLVFGAEVGAVWPVGAVA